MQSQVVPGEGLTTVLVDALEDLLKEMIINRLSISPLYSHVGPRLTNLVTSGISETGEERGELAADGGSGVLPEDNLLEFGGGCDLGGIESAIVAAHLIANRSQTHPGLVAHQPLGSGIDLDMVCQWLWINVCGADWGRTGWKTISSAIPAEPTDAH